jgi:hypothetical protein
MARILLTTSQFTSFTSQIYSNPATLASSTESKAEGATSLSSYWIAVAAAVVVIAAFALIVVFITKK